MVAIGDAGQGGGWLALAAGADDKQLARRNAVHLFDASQHASWDVQVAKLDSHLHVIHHRTAHQCHAPVVPDGDINRLLDAGDERGECGKEDTSGRVAEECVESGVENTFGGGVSRRFYTGGVAAEHHHALIAQPRERAEIGGPLVYGGEVEFVVAGVDDDASGSAQHQRHGIRDAVVDAQKPDGDLPCLNGIGGVYDYQIGALQQTALAQLDGDEAVR